MMFRHFRFRQQRFLGTLFVGGSKDTKVVTDEGAVPLLVQLLSSPSDGVRLRSVWTLGSITADSCECRELVLSTGALPSLLKQLTANVTASMKKAAIWTLSFVCDDHHQPHLGQIKVCFLFFTI